MEIKFACSHTHPTISHPNTTQAKPFSLGIWYIPRLIKKMSTSNIKTSYWATWAHLIMNMTLFKLVGRQKTKIISYTLNLHIKQLTKSSNKENLKISPSLQNLRHDILSDNNSSGDEIVLTGQEESVHLEIQEQWKEWLQIVIRIPPVSWSSLSGSGIYKKKT